MTGFLDALTGGPILFDGAMGSLLYERGIFYTHSFDELNLSRPELILDVHRQYREAGAQVLETNTFGANRLALTKHGHNQKTVEINQRAVALAKETAGDACFVAGAVGPTGVPYGVATLAERKLVEEALSEQISTLAAEGVDLICLETFHSIVELELAISLSRKHADNLPIVAHLVFDENGEAQGGIAPKTAAARLGAAGADVVGANCGLGPPELYQVGVEMVEAGFPVIIQPNAGLPSTIDGRTLYVANPEHFGVFARRILKSGVKLIGGCCGTTPEHIRSMLGAVRMIGASESLRLTAGSDQPAERPVSFRREATTALKERSRLGQRIANREFAVSVELTAPAGCDDAKLTAAIQRLLASGVDTVNIADGPRATARMGNLAACHRAQDHSRPDTTSPPRLESILHVCCRDRNYLGLVSHLMGAHALGIRNLVIITGDPPKMGDYPFATPVYDVESVGLLRMAAALNAGVDPTGREIDGHTDFVLATGAEPAASDFDRELRRLEEKRDAGAELVMTQPVYDPATLERFLSASEGLGLPIMVGLLPLASHRNAEFLHNEVPGMSIPEEFRRRMAAAGSGAPARAEGIKIAQECLAAVKDRVAGAYIMPPFNRVESAVAVLDVVKDRWTPATDPA